MRPSLLCLVVIGLTWGGCAAPAERPPHTAASSPPSSAGPDPAQEYPASDQPWAPSDYQRAAAFVAALAEDDYAALPTEGAPGAAFYARVVDRTQLAQLSAAHLPVGARVQAAIDVLGALQVMLSSYLRGASLGAEHFHGMEVIGLVAVTLEVTLITVTNTAEFVASLPPEEAQSPSRVAGFEQMRDGVRQMVTGSVSMFLRPERDLYSVPALERHGASLVRNLPALLAPMDPAVHVEVGQILTRARQGETDPAVRAVLEEVMAALVSP